MVGFIVFIVVFFVEYAFKPRIDKTINGKYLLWYGLYDRKYIEL